MSQITLEGATNEFQVAGLDKSALRNQESVFQKCLLFLNGIEKTKRQNTQRTSYSLKHMVENPSGHFGIRSSQRTYTGYVYEGTLILAALASGFSMRQQLGHLKATFDISERGLKRRVKEFSTSEPLPQERAPHNRSAHSKNAKGT